MRTLVLQQMDSDPTTVALYVELKRFRPPSGASRDTDLLAAELRDFVVSEMSRIGHIDTNFARTLFHMARAGNISLYLDGFDEMRDIMYSSDDRIVTVYSAALWSLVQPFAQTIVSSRYYRQFTATSEMVSSCVCFELQPLSATLRETILRHYLDAVNQERAMNDTV